MDGGIFRLLGLISAHRGAVEYDLSHRFSGRCPRGLRSVGDTVTIFELARLVTILSNDPSSAIAAAAAGWDYPISREALVLMDLYDLDLQVATGGKAKDKHPGRPYRTDDRQRTRKGNAAGRSMVEIRDILNAHGHSLPPV